MPPLDTTLGTEALPPSPQMPWYHVVQRGMGRRPVFATALDVRALLELVAREVDRGSFELHAFAVLTNHCHLLVRARPPALSLALQRAFAVYARRLNRRLRRDGPLFGSRSRVRRIRSRGHWRSTVAYIDRNAVDAGLARTPAEYPFGSAWHFARPSGPVWLQREVVEDFVRREAGATKYRAGDYVRVFGDTGVPAGPREVVALRLSRPERAEDPLDNLLAAAPADVQRWLERMARQADGAAAGPALVDPKTLLTTLASARRGQATWWLDPPRAGAGGFARTGRERRGGLRRDGWRVLACGLLRSACGLTLEEIGQRVGLSVGGVHFQIRCHSRMVGMEGVYRARAELVLSAALKTDFPDAAAGALPGAFWSR
jgi:REP element-mobilizing transposase RayT